LRGQGLGAFDKSRGGRRRKVSTDTDIPEGLTPEQEKFFKDLAQDNDRLAQQLRQVRVVVKGGTPKGNGSGGSNPNREQAKALGLPTNPMQAIRKLCSRCMGWQPDDRKPWKKVRECCSTECPLHPFRLGQNPYNTHRLMPGERKRRSDHAKTLGKNTESL